MIQSRRLSLALAALALIASWSALSAQAQEPAGPPPATATPAPPAPPGPAELPVPVEPSVPPVPDPDPDIFDDDRDGRQDVVRVGQDFTLAAGDEARDVVVVMGNATIEGRVRELVVVMGSVRLGPTAVIDRTVVSVVGGLQAAEGATVGREVVVIAGALDAPPGFGAGRQHVVINPMLLGASISSVVPYFTEGLMWGRLIVPSFGWIWGVVGLFFIVYLVVNLLADEAVRTTATVLDEKLLTAFGTGLLVLLLLGPVSFLLAVSLIGILVVPVLFCAQLAATLVGKVAVFRWLGARVWRGERGPREAMGTFLIGFALVTLIYMVPVLGVIAFALLSVLGLGAASLAFVAAYRREQPPAPAAPAAPPPIPSGDSAHGASGASAVAEGAAFAVGAVPPPAAPVGYDSSGLPRGAFRDRLAAFVLDLILVVLVVQVVWPFRGGRVFFLALLAYHIGFWAWKHTTVGGIICQLRIVRVDGVPLSVGDAFVRGLSAIFSVVVMGLGFFWVLRDPERQSWHDKIAGTYVVKVPRNWRG